MKKNPSRLTKNLIEMGKDLKEIGLLDEEEYEKITIRLLKKEKKILKTDSIEQFQTPKPKPHKAKSTYSPQSS